MGFVCPAVDDDERPKLNFGGSVDAALAERPKVGLKGSAVEVAPNENLSGSVFTGSSTFGCSVFTGSSALPNENTGLLGSAVAAVAAPNENNGLSAAAAEEVVAGVPNVNAGFDSPVAEAMGNENTGFVSVARAALVSTENVGAASVALAASAPNLSPAVSLTSGIANEKTCAGLLSSFLPSSLVVPNGIFSLGSSAIFVPNEKFTGCMVGLISSTFSS